MSDQERLAELEAKLASLPSWARPAQRRMIRAAITYHRLRIQAGEAEIP